MKGLSKEIRRQKWKASVEEWMSSGLSIRRWCLEHEIADSTFHHWIKVFGSKPSKPAPLFRELPQEKSSKIEMECSGVKIAVDQDYDEQLLIRCLQTLRRL